ncbi:MAG TPA: rod shape-determining protein MreC [Terriglobales bacterium]|jgi:rod shape-determining protein MreC|nr:rod shape-determining protein MreC [Terriglobales bacterium]
MESFFSRYRNPMILGMVLLLQVFGLAVQVKRPIDPRKPEAGSVRMIRLWISGVITPVERVFVATGNWFGQSWHDYLNIGGLRRENRELREQNEQLRIQQAQMAEDAAQGRRLQALLDFKQHFVSQTVAAQVIGSSGTELSRILYIDRGARDGIRSDMAVITPDGVVGKVKDVFPFTAQVLVMNDASSGVGALLEKSRLHGVVKGTTTGDLTLEHVMVDEKVEPGERVLTSGGDRIYPKGLPIGTVAQISSGNDLFLNIHLKPAADLNRLDEVLVVTQPQLAQADSENPVKAADILAQRLPGITQKPAESTAGVKPGPAGNSAVSNTKPTPSPAKPKVVKPPVKTVPQNEPAATPSPIATPASTPEPSATAPEENKPQ